MGELYIRVGRAGTGKSSDICRDIASAVHADPLGPPIFWIVPDDVAYATERMLMNEVSSTLRAEVITMRRLADRVWSAVKSGNVKVINTTGKRLLLASVYTDVNPHLGPLRREHPSIAYFDMILHAFDEMSKNLVDLDQLESAIEIAATSLARESGARKWTAGHSLLGKLRDLCILYVHFRRAMEEGLFIDPAHWLTYVQPHLTTWLPLSDATIYLDGFTDLPPQAFEFTMALIECAKSATLTLSMEKEWLRDQGFHIWHRNRQLDDTSTAMDVPRLLRLLGVLTEPGAVFAPKTLLLCDDIVRCCEERKIPYQIRSNDIPYKFGENSDLLHLERHLYGEHVTVHSDTPSHIRIVRAQNLRAEVDGLAREIKRLFIEEGISYQKMAVVAGDLGQYTAYLQDIFGRYDIPYNLDEFPSLATYPLAKFLLSALCIVQEEFSTTSVQRLLKTDFCGLTEDEADWFETYLSTYEINHTDAWFEINEWKYATHASDGYRTAKWMEEDAKAERLRQRILEYLAPFYEVVRKRENSPKNIAEAIWNLFQAVGAKRIVAHWMVNEDGSQNPLQASLHEQAWQMLIALCNDLTSVAPDAVLSQADILHILQNDIERQSLSNIPVGVNQVLVTDLSRAHAWSVDVCFVIGMTDKAVPRRIRASGLLQDEERIAFQRLFGRAIGYTSIEEQFAGRQTIYECMTRARQKLVLTYPLSSQEGKEQRPSTLLERIVSLFPEGTWSNMEWSDDYGTVLQDESTHVVLTPDAALEILISQARVVLDGNDSLLARPIVEWFLENEVRQQRLFQSLRGFTHRHEQQALPSELSQSLYGEPFKANVYQLESFAACPYKHFAQYGLKVNPVETRAVNPALRGTLLHDVLMAFVTDQMRDMERWKQMSDDDAMISIEQHFRTMLHSAKAAAWHRAEFRLEQANDLLSILRQGAVVLTRHARYGSFSPNAVELAFGSMEGGDLPSFDVQTDDGLTVSLRGRIDRVDAYDNGDEHYFRIIDYKSSQLDVDLTKVAHGLRLQLPVYAAAIQYHSQTLFGKPSKAAGILYIPIVRMIELKNAPTDEPTAYVEALKRMRARGWMVADRTVIGAMDERLLEGQDTELFPKVYTKSQSLSKLAPALAEDEWDMLIARAMSHVRGFGKRILSGEIALSPYRLGQTESACSFCSYQALCQIDFHFDAAVFRRLDKLKRSDLREVWSSFVEQEVKR